jgi:hypothetical protein
VAVYAVLPQPRPHVRTERLCVRRVATLKSSSASAEDVLYVSAVMESLRLAVEAGDLRPRASLPI